MDKRHENQFTMFKATDRLFTERKSSIETIPALAAKAAAFHSLCLDIEAKSGQVMSATSGKAKEKQDAEDSMLELTTSVKAALKCYGEDKGEQAIKELASIGGWKVSCMRDTDQKTYATTIYNLATANAEALVHYGVSAEEIAQLKTAIDKFDDKMTAREASPAERSGMRSTLLTLFDTGAKLLDQTDDLMVRFRTKDAELYNQYIAIRPIKATGVRHKPQAPATDQPAQPK